MYVVLSSDFGPSREARPNDNPFREPLTASGEGSARLGSRSTDNRVTSSIWDNPGRGPALGRNNRVDGNSDVDEWLVRRE